MVLDSSGNVGIGTTNPAHKLSVEGVINTSSYILLGDPSYPRIQATDNDLFLGTTGASSTKFFTANNAGSTLFEIATNGDVTGSHGSYHTSSDERLKKDIVTIPDALDKVLALRGVNFKWKNESKGTNLRMGLISQEVEPVIPEVVHTQTDEMETKAVEYQFLAGLFVEAIKEQQEQIEELRAIIKGLES